MTAHPQPVPPTALDVVWPETLALFRWNLSAFLTTARGDDPSDPDGGLADVESAIASIDAAAAISHGFGPWDDAACAWVSNSPKNATARLSGRSITTAAPVVAWWNAERGPDSYLDRFPAAARPFCERAYNDGVRDGESHGEALAKAVREALANNPDDFEAATPAAYAAILAALNEYDGEGSPAA